MSVNAIFDKIEKITGNDLREFLSVLEGHIRKKEQIVPKKTFLLLKSLLQRIIDLIDKLAAEINKDDTVLISVKNQQLLRKGFQIITSLGISPCLIPGLGLNQSETWIESRFLRAIDDDRKYEIVVSCTDFFTRSYSVPVLKNIIMTLHLSDYLAALIQLSFVPIKKPGNYKDYVMTQEQYDKLQAERVKFKNIYTHLINNCFQPILMKELLALQCNTNPVTPMFVNRLICKEMSERLLVPGGLLSLIRCFMESYDVESGYGWKKINMISRLLGHTHGWPEDDYVLNICSQLKPILALNNMQYLATAIACVLRLYDRWRESIPIKELITDIFFALDYDYIVSNKNLPSTIILSTLEVEHKVNTLHAFACTTQLDWPVSWLLRDLYLLFLIGMKCNRNEDLKSKVTDTILKVLENLKKEEFRNILKLFLFGKDNLEPPGIVAEEYDAGVALKCVASLEPYSNEAAVSYFLNIFGGTTNEELIVNIFKESLCILINLSNRRRTRGNKDILLMEDNPELMDVVDQQYAAILQLLSAISINAKITNALKKNPFIVSDFIQHFIVNENSETNSECVSIALVLLNTILSSSYQSVDFHKSFGKLIPVLKNMVETDKTLNSFLYQEALSLLTSEHPIVKDSAYEKAITDIFDEHLPVRAHATIELTKLIEEKDFETLSKKHFLFCIFQSQLKDPDSYIYLSAINALAALGNHCPEDVLHVLCNEFLQMSDKDELKTKDGELRVSELRMKIGEVIMKVTRRLDERATVHKTMLLNTMLCGCRDEDPLVRASALSNLAEIAFVLHYRIGPILSEVLICLFSVIQSDKAVECRRAAVLAINCLLKGLGKETLFEFQTNLLPIYRLLKKLYSDYAEDKVVRLHAQLALEELDGAVKIFLHPEFKMEKEIQIHKKSEFIEMTPY